MTARGISFQLCTPLRAHSSRVSLPTALRFDACGNSNSKQQVLAQMLRWRGASWIMHQSGSEIAFPGGFVLKVFSKWASLLSKKTPRYVVFWRRYEAKRLELRTNAKEHTAGKVCQEDERNGFAFDTLPERIIAELQEAKQFGTFILLCWFVMNK